MKTFVFVGRQCEIAGFPTLERFGQKIDLPEKLWEARAQHGGPHLLTTDEYSTLEVVDDTPTDAQRRAAWKIIHDLREGEAN